MARRQCYHCKAWLEPGEPHDCWTTTEAALTDDLSEDLRDAWERVREAAVDLGEQRIYASHHSIMFARGSCYFFVRPKRSALELCIFLGREVQAPEVRKVIPSSTSTRAHIVHVVHRDQVEPPITDWLREAYEYGGERDAARGAKGTGTPGGSGRSSRAGAAGKAGPAKKAGATKTAGGAGRTGPARSTRATGRGRGRMPQ